MLIYGMLSGIPIGLLHKIANECKDSHAIVYRAGRRYKFLEGPSLMDIENFGGASGGGPVLVFGNIGGAMAPLAPRFNRPCK